MDTTPQDGPTEPVGALGRKRPRGRLTRCVVIEAVCSLLAVVAGLAAAFAFVGVFVGSGLAAALHTPGDITFLAAFLICGWTTWKATPALMRRARRR